MDDLDTKGEYLSDVGAMGSCCGGPQGPWEATENRTFGKPALALPLEQCVFTAYRMFLSSCGGIKRPEMGGQAG